MSSQPDRYDILFEPVRIGPRQAPNRFFGLPYSLGGEFDADVAGSAAHQGMRAEGGWGVVGCGECTFSAESDGHGLSLARDEQVADVAALADAIHEHGALALLELAHAGGAGNPLVERVPALAPSQLQWDAPFFGRAIPKAMELDEIRRVQREWVDAARRARAAGFDLVCVYGAHSSLLMQFLSPFYNHRTDRYGGSLENRARMWIETLTMVREAVGDELGVTARIAIDALGPAGVELEEGLEFVRMADELVDLWDVTVGGLDNSRVDLSPSRVYPEGFPLQWSERVSTVTGKPVVGNGRLTSPDLMVSLIESGKLTMIGGARPGIADPFLPNKIRGRRFTDIRECIGCLQCAQRQIAGRLGCSQNATAGEEARRGWHPERFEPLDDPKLPILIVGAGPAGMEAASVLGRRGAQSVHLVDAAAQMGGHLGWFTQLPGFRPWWRLAEFREAMIVRQRGVKFVPKTRLDLDGVLDYGAEVVIVATGARWSEQGLNLATHAAIPGADGDSVFTPEQLISEARSPAGPRLVVFDGEGELVGAGLAQWLQQRGHQVTLVTPYPSAFIYAEHAGEAPTLRRELVTAGAELVTGSVISQIGPDRVVVVDEYERLRTIECDGVVLASQRVSDDDLYQQLMAVPERLEEAGIAAVYRIGDCVTPRLLAEATFEGHRLARRLHGDGTLAP